jgi:hypothetical protein
MQYLYMPLRCMGKCKYSSTFFCFFYLGTRWIVSLNSWPLYPEAKSHRYPLDGRLDGPQSRSGQCGESNPDTSAVQSKVRRYRMAYPNAFHKIYVKLHFYIYRHFCKSKNYFSHGRNFRLPQQRTAESSHTTWVCYILRRLSRTFCLPVCLKT